MGANFACPNCGFLSTGDATHTCRPPGGLLVTPPGVVDVLRLADLGRGGVAIAEKRIVELEAEIERQRAAIEELLAYVNHEMATYRELRTRAAAGDHFYTALANAMQDVADRLAAILAKD